MYRLVTWVQTILVPSLGPWGLLVAAFLDSSFIALPEVTDLMVVSWSASKPQTAWIPILMSTLGSVAGCAVIWWLGMRGGEPAFERRFGAERLERTRAAFSRWHLLTLAVPAMLPAPMPFKVFVIAAGVFGVSLRRMVVTVSVARGVRYVIWSLLGMAYGQEAFRALQLVDRWFMAHWAALLAVVLLAGLAVWVTRGLRRRSAIMPTGDLDR